MDPSDWLSTEGVVGGLIVSALSTVGTYHFSKWKEKRDDEERDRKQDIARAASTESTVIGWTGTLIDSQAKRIQHLEAQFDAWAKHQEEREKFFTRQQEECEQRISLLTSALAARDAQIQALRIEVHDLRRELDGRKDRPQ